MTSTVENISANIDRQIDIIDQFISILINIIPNENIMEIIEEFNNVKTNYYMSTIDILKEYYENHSLNNLKKIKHNQYVKSIKAINLVGSMKRLYNLIIKYKKIYNIIDSNFLKLNKEFESIVIDENFESDSSDVCTKCKIIYEIEEKTAEFTCKNCGHIEKMYGVVFEDDQFFYQEGQRTKHGKYDPIKHAKFWLDRIQGKETTDIPESVINDVKRCIKRDQLWIHNVTCEVVRNYLKQTKNTKYNNHVVLIRKMITGLEPSQLTEHEIRLTYRYFGISTQKFNQLKGDSKKNNCPYHPFFIYKIIEQILKKNKDLIRRQNILSCIHLQSRDTLIENDKIWFEICDSIPEFTKIATDGGARRIK
jgi:hypothetical protein